MAAQPAVVVVGHYILLPMLDLLSVFFSPPNRPGRSVTKLCHVFDGKGKGKGTGYLL